MLFLRFIFLLGVVSLAVSFGLYLFTHQRRYLTWTKHIGRMVIGIIIVFAALLILERLIVI